LAVGVLALPYAIWSASHEAGSVAVARSDLEPAAGSAESSAGSEPIPMARREALPPLNAFAAILDRPLFNSERRPPQREAPIVNLPTETHEPQAPIFRLVGTVRQGGRTYGLVTEGEGHDVERVTVGDALDGWRVDEVTGDLLVITRAGERHQLQILR
jgi:hypothetical protein